MVVMISCYAARPEQCFQIPKWLAEPTDID